MLHLSSSCSEHLNLFISFIQRALNWSPNYIPRGRWRNNYSEVKISFDKKCSVLNEGNMEFRCCMRQTIFSMQRTGDGEYFKCYNERSFIFFYLYLFLYVIEKKRMKFLVDRLHKIPCYYFYFKPCLTFIANYLRPR